MFVCFVCADANSQRVYDNDVCVCLFVALVCLLCSCRLLACLVVLFVLIRNHKVSMTTTCLFVCFVCADAKSQCVL